MTDINMRSAFTLENIRVLESLPSGEPQTGTDLSYIPHVAEDV
jgi:hypothetical protein